MMVDVSGILQTLAKKNYYLVAIYDGEYKQYIVEILDPYGEVQSAGLAPDFEKSITEALDNILTKVEFRDEE